MGTQYHEEGTQYSEDGFCPISSIPLQRKLQPRGCQVAFGTVHVPVRFYDENLPFSIDYEGHISVICLYVLIHYNLIGDISYKSVYNKLFH